MDDTRTSFTRRQFLMSSGTAAGLIGIGGLLASRTEAGTNPFAYDVSHLAKTDPKLIQYEQVGKLSSPHPEARCLAVGADDSICVGAGKYVSVVDNSGVPVREIALAAPATCLGLTPGGELYAGLRDHVEVFDRKGQRTASWPAPGSRTWLTGMAISGGDFYLADAGHRILWHCDRAGKVLGRIGQKDKERNIPGFIVPSPFFAVAMHRDGLLRVANPGRHRVEAYTTAGDFEFAWGKPSAAIDGFCGCCNPIDIALLPDGRVVTCEKGLPRVKVYNADGTLESVVAGTEAFPENARVCAARGLNDCTRGGLAAAIDSNEQIYILDLVTAEIRVMARKASNAKAG